QSPDQLVDEIRGCKPELEEMIGRPVRFFAFPFGFREHMTAARFPVAAEAGYDGVCSAYGGYNFPGDDPFHLRRFHADREFVRFKNLLTVCPRKHRGQRDFDPGDYRSNFVARKGAKAQSEDSLELLTAN